MDGKKRKQYMGIAIALGAAFGVVVGVLRQSRCVDWRWCGDGVAIGAALSTRDSEDE